MFPPESRLQGHLAPPHTLAGKQVHPGRPGLILCAHGSSGFTVVPLIELPALVELGKILQRPLSSSATAGFHQSRDIEAAKKRPHAAIVVVIRSVERPVVTAPVR